MEKPEIASKVKQLDLFSVSGARVCGVDEAGRGPLAGAVVAAAVILHPDRAIPGLADSKKLSARKRERLALEIKQQAWAWAVAEASVEEIDQLNILQASLLAMKRAVMSLSLVPDRVLVDGNQLPDLPYSVQAIIGGDASQPSISAASILAKTSRDAALIELDQRYPDYGFAQHKGYPTPQHLQAIRQYGVLPVHRKSFAPVAKLCT
ncbi:MAG: ribonuclease HII [Burkholderiales bacterium]|jgi:ribonuclease HII|nr:ribonuclease HII [Burkholderiales bacterium]MCA3160917.1 ribonuclease HII [Burkholderiales bacterium]MCA3163530.1 ribonuclease HII [Burkholderiales bacterium]MCA3165760.1 ribonuclease HII [Burkholderiales bacterium]MCA3170237.1 ribonuclease HII [Burkholderiales bacterium]